MGSNCRCSQRDAREGGNGCVGLHRGRVATKEYIGLIPAGSVGVPIRSRIVIATGVVDFRH